MLLAKHAMQAVWPDNKLGMKKKVGKPKKKKNKQKKRRQSSSEMCYL